MKKLLLILLVSFVLVSCAEAKKCDYNKVVLTSTIKGQLHQKKEIEDCFCVVKMNEGTMYTVKGDKSPSILSATYYEEPNSVSGIMQLDYLNINLSDKKIEWRAKKGHDISLIKTKEAMTFIFTEPEISENLIAGSLEFTK